jgi:hypothetical protein
LIDFGSALPPTRRDFCGKYFYEFAMRTGASANFDRLDTKKDRALSQAEIAAGRVKKPAPAAAR